MSSLKVIDSLLQIINAYEPVCNISIHQGIPYERELGLLLSTLKTRNLYKLNIDHIYSKLQTLLNEMPIHIKHNLINKYYSHSWISHVSYKFHETPLSIFVTLLKRYVIRKKFNTLWNIIVLLLENGAYPLLTPVLNNNTNRNILSLKLIWSLYLHLFNFIDDENEILAKVSFVLSFVDKFKFRTFILEGIHYMKHYFNIINYYPSICTQTTGGKYYTPSPAFLHVLLQFGYPIFHTYDITLNNNLADRIYHLPFVVYHQMFFNEKLMDLKAVYCEFEKDKRYPILVDGMYDLIIGMAYGNKMVKKYVYFNNDYSYYLYNLFSLTSEWMKWSFINFWQYQTDKQLSEITRLLSLKFLYLSEWSGRVRESSSNFSAEFIKFYIKIVQLQTIFKQQELVLWMKKYENNTEILQLLFKQKYIISNRFPKAKIYEYLWNILCEKDKDSIILRLLNKHLVHKSVDHKNVRNTLNNFEKNLCLPLFNEFCDKFNGLNWKIKNNLMVNMTELLQKWKLNELEIVNTYYGLKCIFNGASIPIFKQLTNNNLLNIKEIESNNNGSIDVIFAIFEERGKYIQTRHQKIMTEIGKWLINNNNKNKLIQFVNELTNKCKQITQNYALKQRQSLMIKQFKQQWNLH